MEFRKPPFSDPRFDAVLGKGFLFLDHRHHWLTLKRSVGPISEAEAIELRGYR